MMNVSRLVAAALVGLLGSSVALADNDGTITGTYRPFPASCKQPSEPHLNGVVAIPGTSFSAHLKANGKFAIYNVKPGRYSLALWSLSGVSFELPGTLATGPNSTLGPKFTVKNGKTTNLGIVSSVDNCCGNGVIDGSEVCDGGDLDGKTCESFGLPAGALLCNSRCDTIVTRDCGSNE